MDNRDIVCLVRRDAVDGAVQCAPKTLAALHAVEAQAKMTLVNPGNSEMQHDFLSEFCAEDRES
jgi:hypothetical protein